MIDRRYIGLVLPAFEVPVDAGRLRFFAKATGNTDPVHVDEAGARDAGHANLPVPPTFLFCLEMDQPNPGAMRELLGLDYRSLLHGEQHFRYHAMAHAGDRLRFEPRIADIYAKKGGALEFVVRETTVTNQHGALVAELKCLTVVRHAEMIRPRTDAGAPIQAGAASGPAEPDPLRPPETPAPRGASYESVHAGDALPALRADPISRLTLALYCGASGDHNPIHVDIDFARAAGMDDVFAHGMLGMAYLARLVTGWVPQRAIHALGTRFASITHVGDRITCSGTVAEKLAQRRVRLALSAHDQAGIVKLAGDAIVELP
jgi:acyl dehydratase